MDLQTFVKESLLQVLSGVQEAQKEQGTQAWLINPKIRTGWKVRDMEFDVALTASTKTEGVMVVNANQGGKGERASEQSYVSRVKFSVPIVFPMSEVTPKFPGET